MKKQNTFHNINIYFTVDQFNSKWCKRSKKYYWNRVYVLINIHFYIFFLILEIFGIIILLSPL